MQGKIIPDIVERMNIASVTVGDTILTAAKKMADAHIAALIIVDADGMLIGIITERDLTQKVVGKRLDPKTRSVTETMSSPLIFNFSLNSLLLAFLEI